MLVSLISIEVPLDKDRNGLKAVGEEEGGEDIGH